MVMLPEHCQKILTTLKKLENACMHEIQRKYHSNDQEKQDNIFCKHEDTLKSRVFRERRTIMSIDCSLTINGLAMIPVTGFSPQSCRIIFMAAL